MWMFDSSLNNGLSRNLSDAYAPSPAPAPLQPSIQENIVLAQHVNTDLIYAQNTDVVPYSDYLNLNLQKNELQHKLDLCLSQNKKNNIEPRSNIKIIAGVYKGKTLNEAFYDILKNREGFSYSIKKWLKRGVVSSQKLDESIYFANNYLSWFLENVLMISFPSKREEFIESQEINFRGGSYHRGYLKKTERLKNKKTKKKTIKRRIKNKRTRQKRIKNKKGSKIKN